MWRIKNIQKIKLLHLSMILGMICWTGILFGLYAWAVRAEQNHFNETIKLKAESFANHTQTLNDWIGGHGGVYVEVDDVIKPHPLLATVSERDVDTPSGRKLTFLNSPSVLSQISPYFESTKGDRIHLVSTRPMNPSNSPDAWEREALDDLESGKPKVEAFVYIGDESLFRLMYPMQLTPKCLSCHHYLANTPNKVVGDLSVTVDKRPYDRLSEDMIRET